MPKSNVDQDYQFDVFVSYAWQDRDYILPLINALQEIGLRVWWDHHEITLGDRLTKAIDDGLSNSRYGIVIISASFIGKHWPEAELRSLLTRATSTDDKVLLPIRLGITHSEFAHAYPLLADIVTEELGQDVSSIVPSVLRAIKWTETSALSRQSTRFQEDEPTTAPPTRSSLQKYQERSLHDTLQPRHIVFLLHGIRTQGEWMTRVSHLLHNQAEVTAVRQITYGFLDSIRFLLPIPFLRRRPILRILNLMLYEITADPNVKLSVIAHSFGAYIIGTILMANPAIRIHRLLLCGSILPNTFEWDKIRDSQLSVSRDGNWSVINDCGTRDIWPVLAQFVTFGYGSSGRFGFGHPRVKDRYFNIKHSGYFEEENVVAYWTPFITKGEIVPGVYHRYQTPWWLSLLTVVKLPYIVVVVVVVILTLSNISSWVSCLPAETRLQCIIENIRGGHIPEAPKVQARTKDGHVLLSWQPENNDGDRILGWQFRTRRVGTSKWTPEWTNIGPESATKSRWKVQGLEIGLTYEFQLRGIGRNGAGASSNTLPVRVLALPTQPTLLAEERDQEVMLTWIPGPSSGGGTVQWMYRWKGSDAEQWSEWIDVFLPKGTNTYVVNDLKNGEEYAFQMRGKNELGPGTPSKMAFSRPRGVPGAPSISTVAGVGSVRLRWEPGSENGSIVSLWQYRTSEAGSLEWGTWSDIPDGSSNHEYTVRGLKNGREYSLQMRAVNQAGYGELSPLVQAQPRGTPDEPTLAATEGDSGVLLRWEPGSDNGAAVTRWQYRLREAGSLGWRTWSDIPDGSSNHEYTVRGLKNGREYSLQMRAVNQAGYGEPSPLVQIQPRGTPDEPTLAATEGDSGVLLRWEPGSDNGAAVTRWQYRLREAGSLGWRTWSDIPDGSSNHEYTVRGLKNGRKYSFQMRAVNQAGYGEPSPLVQIQPRGTPDEPTLAATEGDSGVLLRWEPGSDNGAAVTRWQYRLREAGSLGWRTWSDIPDGSSNHEYTVRGLKNGREYSLQMRAVNQAGYGEPSPLVQIQPRGTPDEPTLAATEGDSGVLLRWEPGSDNGAAVTRWQYRLREAGSLGWRTWSDIPDGSSNHEYTVRGLKNGRKYSLQMRAVNQAGYGEPSPLVQAQPRGTPDEPTLAATEGDSGVLLRWEPGSDNGATVTRWQYRLSQKGLGWNAWNDISEVGKQNTFLVSGLVNGENYKLQLRAINEIGNGKPSEIVSAQPRGTPDAPVLSVTGSVAKAELTWKAGSDSGSSVERWQYRFYGGFFLGWSDWYNIPPQVEGSRHVVTGLARDRAYRFQLRAVNAIGEGKSSEIVTAITSKTGAVDLGKVRRSRERIMERLGGSAPNHCVQIDGVLKCRTIP